MIKKLKVLFAKTYANDLVLKKFLSGAFWVIFGNVVVKGLSLLASLFIAKFLGNVTFGELSIVKTTLSVFSLLATFGLGLTVTKFIAEIKQKDHLRLGKIIASANIITLCSGLLLGLLIFIFSSYISKEILNSNNLIVPLRIASIYLLFNALNVSQIGVISGLEAYKKLAHVNLIMGAVTLPVLLGLTYFFGLNGTLWGLTFNLVLNWYLNKRIIKKEIKNLEIDLNYLQLLPEISRLLKFGYPLALKEGIYAVSNWICLYLLLVKTSYGEVGVFNSANQLAQLILFLPLAIVNVALSSMSGLVDDRQNYISLIKKNIIINVVITSIIGITMLFLADFIYDFYGSSFEGGQETLIILVIATIPMAITNVLEQVCISSSKPILVTVFVTYRYLIILPVAFYLFVFNQEASTLAISMLIGHLVAMTSMYFYLRHIGLITENK